MPHTLASPHKTLGSAMLMLAGSILLSGCALNGGTGSSAASAAAATSHGLSGIVHGGQNPVTGATVILWAAGAPSTGGGYGTGATIVATTTTDGNGNFGFNNTSGVSPCNIGQYNYVTATGGNSGAGTNNYIAMMAAIPTPCSATTGATTVFIDEVTTVAAVTALQQFMSINTSFTPPYIGGTGNVPWTIGAPSTNVIGLANAFSMTPMLASITTGTTGNSFPSNTITPNNSSTAQLFTTAVVPETSKINGLANILATCVNDTTGNLCTGSSGVLTLTTIAVGATSPTYTVPGDTIQAAYNMATLPNPVLYSGAKYWKSSTSSTTYLSTLWSNNTAQAPFQPYSASTPTDTSITLQWKTTGPTNGTTGTVYAASVAIDGKGDIWIGAGSPVTNNLITQFQPNGQILQDIVTVNLPSYTLSYYPDSTTASTGSTTANAAYTLGYGRPIGAIAIDTNNNAWFNSFGAATPGTIATELTGLLAEVSQTGTATGYVTGAANGFLSIDGSNNLFMNAAPVTSSGSNRYYLEMVSNASSYQANYEGIGRSTGIYNGLAQDSNGYVWGFLSSCTAPETLSRVNAAGEISSTVTTLALTAGCAYQGAGDANGNMWSTDGANLDYITTSTGNFNVSYTGGAGTGLVSVNSLAVDGNGYVWAVNKGTTGTAGSAGIAEFATSSTPGAATLLSPTGTSTAPLNGFGSMSALYGGSPEGVALDPSGNVWFATTVGSYLYVTVGIAAPTRTPLSASYAHIGTRP